MCCSGPNGWPKFQLCSKGHLSAMSCHLDEHKDSLGGLRLACASAKTAYALTQVLDARSLRKLMQTTNQGWAYTSTTKLLTETDQGCFHGSLSKSRQFENFLSPASVDGEDPLASRDWNGVAWRHRFEWLCKLKVDLDTNFKVIPHFHPLNTVETKRLKIYTRIAQLCKPEPQGKS